MKSRILFVDDERNFLEGVRLMLRGQRNEWDLSFASSVDEALDKIVETEFHVVVSDVSMPEKNGLDLLRELNERGLSKVTPVIILTGNAEADLKRRALDLGATDLLNKPVTAEDILARIRSVLRLRSYQDELRESNDLLEQRVLQRTQDLDYSRRDIVWRLAKAGEFRDEETGDHVIRVACCSRALAVAYKLDPEMVASIFLTSPLHDIGKIGVPDSILLKKGSLDADERAIMEKHCEIGASILLEEPKGMRVFIESSEAASKNRLAFLENDPLKTTAATIAMSHHEKWDGSGYPKGLAGEDIPLVGRIVAVADVYDALRAERPYKKSFTMEKTLDVMREGAGVHFDPQLFVAFEETIEEFEAIRERYKH